MDDPSIGGPELERTLDELAVINRTLGGTRVSWRGVSALLPTNQPEVSLLDVGTGAAATPRHLVEQARARGVRLRVRGIDLSDTTVAHARSRCTGWPEITVERQNLYTLGAEDRVDIVHSSLVLHHFPGEEAIRALAAMWRLARVGVVINDLHRHPVAWVSIRGLTRVFSKNRLIRSDGAISVLRAFSRAELLALATQAGLPPPELRWEPMFRWLMIFRR